MKVIFKDNIKSYLLSSFSSISKHSPSLISILSSRPKDFIFSLARFIIFSSLSIVVILHLLFNVLLISIDEYPIAVPNSNILLGSFIEIINSKNLAVSFCIIGTLFSIANFSNSNKSLSLFGIRPLKYSSI